MNDKDGMTVAIRQSKMSKCKRAKHGAVLIEGDKILGVGHNYAPDPHECVRMNVSHCSDYTGCPSTHAEVQTIASATLFHNTSASLHSHLSRSTMYITGIPCMNCAKLITEMWIRNVVILVPERALSDAEMNILIYLGRNMFSVKFLRLSEMERV